MSASTTRPPRLLMVTTVYRTLQGFLLPYARHFRAQGWTVEAATGADVGVDEIRGEFDRIHEIDWSRSPSDLGNASAVSAMRRLLRLGRYDVVHVHTPIAAFITRVAARLLGSDRPLVVYTAHGFHFLEGAHDAKSRAYVAAERIGGRWTDCEIVINEEDRRQALARGVVPATRLRLFPGIGIDLGYYAPNDDIQHLAGQFRASIGVPESATLYGCIAEFQQGKNHRTLIDAFAGLRDTQAHLALAGTGPTQPSVREQVTALGLESRVHFLGMVRDVRPVILACDATVLPSLREGLSRAVLESLALGVPVVGGRTRGIRDLVTPGLGLLVEPQDSDALRSALVDVLRTPGRGDLRPTSIEGLRRFGIDNLIGMHEDLYAELLAGYR